MSKIVKDSFLVIFSKIFSLVLGVISSIFFIRLLGADGKGDLTIIEVGAALLVLVTSVNLNLGIIHFTSKKKVSKPQILGIAIYMLVFSLLASLIIIFLSEILGFNNYLIPDGNFTEYAILLITTIFVILTKEIFSSFLKGVKQFKDLYASTIIYSIFRLLLFISLFGLHTYYDLNYTTIQLIWAHVACLGVLMLVTFYFFYSNIKIKPDFKPNKLLIKQFYTYATIGMVVLVINFFSRKIDIWIINDFLDKKQLGFYAVAIGLCDLILQIPMTLRSVLFPYMSSMNKMSDRLKLLAVFSRINVAILVVIVAMLFFCASFLIPFMYDDTFSPTIVPFKILIFATAFIGVRSFFVTFLMSEEKQIYNVISSVMGIITLLLLDFYLIPNFGIIGAAWAVFISYFLTMIFIYLVVINLSKSNNHNYFFITSNDINKLKSLLASKFNY